MNEFKINLELPSDTACIALVRQLLPAVRKCGISIPDSAVRKCTLCLVEAFDNAIFHAHGGLSLMPIGVSLKVSKSRIKMEVKDHGKGFCIGRVPKPSIYQISGRGIFIIKNIAQKVMYKNNTLIMEVRP